MKETHQGRGLQSFHFEKVIGHITETMEEMGIQEELIHDLIDRFNLLKPAYLEEE